MPPTTTLRRIFRLATGRPPVESDVDDEIRYHLDATVQELVATGLSPDEARREAIRRFGDVDHVRLALGAIDRDRVRLEQRRERWRTFGTDLAQAARALIREPAFTATVAVTLALGIGANATMFGVIDRLLLRPPEHVRDDGTLSLIYLQRQTPEFGLVTQTSMSYPAFMALRQQKRVFTDVAAFWNIEMSYGHGADAQRLPVSMVTPNLTSLLGVVPVRGRFFTPDEWHEPPVKTAVVTEGFARRAFGSVDGALGKSLELENHQYVIVGVAPAGFTGAKNHALDVFLPIAASAASQAGPEWETTNNMRWIEVVARRQSAADAATAASAATLAYRQLERSAHKGDTLARIVAGSIIPARRPDGSTQGSIALWLAAVSAVVLLIACANVANLLLARATRRRREFAVRVALGVARRRLIAQLLAESLMLAAAGGVLALVLARWGSLALRSTLLREYSWETGAIDWRVAIFTAAAIAVTAMLAGLAPALLSSRPDLTDSLKAGDREGGGRRSRLRSGLIVTQAALSVALLVGAGLFALSFRRASTLDIGMDAEHLIVARPPLSEVAKSPEAYELAWRQAIDRVRRVPGVEAVEQSVTTPVESQWNSDIFLPESGKVPPLKGGGPYENAVGPDYFRAMGTALVRGRVFTSADVKGAPPVAVINEAMSRQVWPGVDPLGRCFRAEADTMPCATIVGIVRNATITSLADEPQPEAFFPVTQWSPSMRVMFVRVKGAPERAVPLVRKTLQSISDQMSYVDVRTMGEVLEPELRPWRLGATMFGIFGMLAFVVAMLGTYSVVAYDVSQRRREIGVRMALGAQRSQMLRAVVGEGVRRAAAGIVIGLLLALMATRFMTALLFHTSPREPAVYVAVAFVLLAAAAVASLAPARQASRMDPVEALRSD